MEKITKYFKHDYENDTTIEYVNTGLYAMLNCSFTSEDPDYGTDTLHYTAESAVQMEHIAYDMLQEVKNFLDFRDGRIESSMSNVQIDYDVYSSSTLIAIESALYQITKDYEPTKRYATIWDASEWVAKELFNNRTKVFNFCASDYEEAKGNPKDHKDDGGWHGIRRIDGFFDNEQDEYIIAVGHYGGGHVGFGYLDYASVDDCAKVVRNAICQATGWDSDNMIYIEEDEK